MKACAWGYLVLPPSQGCKEVPTLWRQEAQSGLASGPPKAGWFTSGVCQYFSFPKPFPSLGSQNLLFAAKELSCHWESCNGSCLGPIAGPPWSGSPTACSFAISPKPRVGLGMGNMEIRQNFYSHPTPYAISLPARPRLSGLKSSQLKQEGAERHLHHPADS